MLRVSFMLLVLRSAALGAAVLGSGSTTKLSGATMESSVDEANLVVLVEVIAPETARTQPTGGWWDERLVRVTKTMKGMDATGDLLAVRTGELSWETGAQYVLFLRQRGVGSMAQSIPVERIAATPDRIAEVGKRLEAEHAKVETRCPLWVVHQMGWSGILLGEFVTTSDGAFVWCKTSGSSDDGREPTYSRLAGRMPMKSVRELVQKIATAEEGPRAKDAGVVTFTWRDEKGVAQGRRYTFPRAKPCSELMKALEEAATRYGVKPTTHPSTNHSNGP